MNFLRRLVIAIRSLRFRLALIIFLLAVIPAVIVLFLYSYNYEKREISSLTATLTSQAQLISSQIVAGGYFSTSAIENSADINEGSSQTISKTNNELSTRLNSFKEMFVGRIMIMDSSMTILIDTYDIYEGRILTWENAIRSLMGETLSEYDNDNHLLSVSLPISNDNGDVVGVILISRSTDLISQNLDYFTDLAYTIMIVVVILSLIISILASYFLMVPIANLSKGISELKEEQRMKLDGSSVNEINKIIDGINEYADRQRNLDTSVKDFLSNVSHELKTPLTSMKIMADSLNAAEDSPVEFYREFMEDIASEIDRETAIINDLIALVKTEDFAGTLEKESVNVNELMESAMKILSPIAEAKHIELVLETFKPVILELDKVKFSQAVINIIENAIKYNDKENGYVHVSVNSDSEHCFIRIEDNGIGIPKEQLSQIFERFYRVDTSHSKEIEGTGLGLSIVKNVVLLHGGQIKADSIENQGTVFTIRLPLVVG